MPDAAGDNFQNLTKYERGMLFGRGLDWSNQPETYKLYRDVPKFALPEPVTAGGRPLWTVVSERRSVRRYSDQPLSMDDLSQLLWACQGVTGTRGEYEFRASPSAGALYPVETYLVANDIEGLDPGVYHYSVLEHGLDQLNAGDYRDLVASAALDQPMAGRAPVVFIWTGIFQRCRWKYRQRAYRYVYLDAGHIVENLALAAVALDLGSCQIGALYDEEVNAIVGVDGVEESTIYMTVVGRPSG
jgi:SagB-type dehydrogenase family enzyme